MAPRYLAAGDQAGGDRGQGGDRKGEPARGRGSPAPHNRAIGRRGARAPSGQGPDRARQPPIRAPAAARGPARLGTPTHHPASLLPARLRPQPAPIRYVGARPGTPSPAASARPKPAPSGRPSRGAARMTGTARPRDPSEPPIAGARPRRAPSLRTRVVPGPDPGRPCPAAGRRDTPIARPIAPRAGSVRGRLRLGGRLGLDAGPLRSCPWSGRSLSPPPTPRRLPRPPGPVGGRRRLGDPPNPRRALGPGIPGALGDLGEGSGAQPPALPVKFTPGPRPGSWIPPSLPPGFLGSHHRSQQFPARFRGSGCAWGSSSGPIPESRLLCSLPLARARPWLGPLDQRNQSGPGPVPAAPRGKRHPQASEEAPQYVFPKG